MKPGFVKTENFKRLVEAEKIVERRGAREAGLVLVKGVYGIGKSTLTSRWAADSNYIYLRAKETWTKRALLDELAEKMGVSAAGRNQQVEAAIIARLAVSPVPLIIDEADFLIRSTPALLEVVRDITDTTFTIAFLVGMEHFATKVGRYDHIASRVARLVELQPLSLADVRATVAAKAEVAIDDEVLLEILRQAGGRMRLVLNAIANIEVLAEANSWKKVGMAQLAGKTLVTEFTGRTLGRARGDAS